MPESIKKTNSYIIKLITNLFSAFDSILLTDRNLNISLFDAAGGGDSIPNHSSLCTDNCPKRLFTQKYY
jgi:Heme/copper-type cytochrome/quinol oxidases, subunit 1